MTKANLEQIMELSHASRAEIAHWNGGIAMKVKGIAIATIPLFIQERFGEGGFNRWINALTPEARKVYQASVLASVWYPLRESLIEPLRKMCDLFYAGDLKGAHEAGRFSADYSLKGIYKIFVKLGSPESMVRRAGSILPMYYTPSEMKVVESRKGQGIVQIIKFQDMDQVLESRIAGWMERALEVSGGKHLNIKITRSLTNGDSVSEFLATWE